MLECVSQQVYCVCKPLSKYAKGPGPRAFPTSFLHILAYTLTTENVPTRVVRSGGSVVGHRDAEVARSRVHIPHILP